MSSEQGSAGIVLRNVAFGESDAVVTLLTRDFGRLSVFARGARSSRKPRFGPALETFMHIAAAWRPRRSGSMPALTTADVIETFDALRGDYDRIAWASYAVEVARETAREGEDTGVLYRLLHGYLSALAERGTDLDDRVAYELAVLAALGVAPRLDACVRCGERRSEGRRYRLAPTAGGALCDRCLGVHAPLSALALEAIADIAGTIPPERAELGIPPSERRAVAAALPPYVEEALDKELKTLPFLQV